ncbi:MULTISPECIES: hypothetical protein, partial [unclassified Alteromonas]|uniref:hypothetical protein n=1 Tax=unclassified Alteromonas TaxID=2614992 RepID=UPI0005096AF2
EGFFDSGDCKSSGTRWRIPADAPRVATPGRGTIIKALAEMRGLFVKLSCYINLDESAEMSDAMHSTLLLLITSKILIP